ncbi:DUF4304 domain-containing protein [Ferruginibacter albus]|uniref:DUF4304 domain-containing protein n=1 Tax=Ferruginibacter albus TaxID=2875540 RepID=UPI001CC56B67|nr:DUF4304 domain-containing protein [Ferruginibacter albus]UAY53138.1 DUF4304 domain-containing protein [Ferruginibacter albus]
MNEIFLPRIQKLGFKGKDFFYYKQNEIYTEVIFFWTYKTGGAIQVDLLVKFNTIVDPTLDDPVTTKDIRPENADFFYRLSESSKKTKLIPDTWFWIFKTEDDENKKLVDDIWRVFSNKGMDFFNKFKNHQEYITQINRTNYLGFPDFQLQRYFGKFELGILYFLFEYWRQLGNNEKAIEFAVTALKKSTSETDKKYISAFEKYLTNNR